MTMGGERRTTSSRRRPRRCDACGTATVALGDTALLWRWHRRCICTLCHAARRRVRLRWASAFLGASSALHKLQQNQGPCAVRARLWQARSVRCAALRRSERCVAGRLCGGRFGVEKLGWWDSLFFAHTIEQHALVVSCRIVLCALVLSVCRCQSLGSDASKIEEAPSRADH